MSADPQPDLHILTVPHLKAYDRSSLRAPSPSPFSREDHKGSPSKYSKAPRGNIFGGWLPGSPFASSLLGRGGGHSSSSSSSSNFSRQTLCFLIVLIAVTSLVSLRYLGHLSKFLQKDDLNTSPAILTISRHEAKQTEKLIELMGKVDEMRERAEQTVTSLEDLLGKAVAQQDQMKGIEDQLRQSQGQAQGQAQGQTQGQGQAGKAPPQAAISALEERVAELGTAMRRQMSSLSASLNATLAGLAAHSQQQQQHQQQQQQERRERAMGEGGQRLQGGDSREGQGAELVRAVGRVEEQVVGAGAQSASALGRLEEKLDLLLAARLRPPHSSAPPASPALPHTEQPGEGTGVGVGGGVGLGREGQGGSLGLPGGGEALGRIEAQVRQLAAGLGKGEAGAGGPGEVAGQVARLLKDVMRLREGSGAGAGAGAGAGTGAGMRPLNGTALGFTGAGASLDSVAGHGVTGGRQECAALESQARLVRASVLQRTQVRLQAAAVSDLRQRLDAFQEAQREEAEETAGGPPDGGERSQRHASISPRALRTWRQGSFQKAGSYGFVAFSWTSPALSLRGKGRLVYPQGEHGAPYEAVLIVCEFGATVPAGGGHLGAYIDHELVLLYKEDPGAFLGSLDAVGPFPAGLSLCVPPLGSRALHPALLRQFLVYHWRTGADHFVLYDAGALGGGGYAGGLLGAEVGRGVVDVVDLWEMRKFDIWNYGEVVALHDCIYRLRYTSEWVAYADIDDYLWTPQIPQNLRNLNPTDPTTDTNVHPNKNSHNIGKAVAQSMRQMMTGYSDVAGVTIGSLWFSVNKCRSREVHVDEVLMPAIAARPLQGLVNHQGQGHLSRQGALLTGEGAVETGSQKGRRRLLQEGAGAAEEAQEKQQGQAHGQAEGQGQGQGQAQGQAQEQAEGQAQGQRQAQEQGQGLTEGSAAMQGTAGIETVGGMEEQQGEFGTASSSVLSTTGEASTSASEHSDLSDATGVKAPESPPLLASGAASGTKEEDSHTLRSQAGDSHSESATQAQDQVQAQNQGGTGSTNGTPGAQASTGVDTPSHTGTAASGGVPGAGHLTGVGSPTSTGRTEGTGTGGASEGGGGPGEQRDKAAQDGGPETDPALTASEVREALLARPPEAVVQQEMAVEQFVFHWPEPACFGNHEKGVNLDPRLCPGKRGHRRFVVNPRKVERMTTFGPLEADVNNVEFVHLVTTDAVFLHYDGLGTRLRPGEHMCNETEFVNKTVGWWRTEPSYARTMAGVRLMQPCNFSAGGWEGCYDLGRG